jgi:hypothetical protein
MLTTQNYYGNPNLIKKVRIRTIASNQNEEFSKVVQNSFTNDKENNKYTNYNESISLVNAVSW